MVYGIVPNSVRTGAVFGHVSVQLLVCYWTMDLGFQVHLYGCAGEWLILCTHQPISFVFILFFNGFSSLLRVFPEELKN